MFNFNTMKTIGIDTPHGVFHCGIFYIKSNQIKKYLFIRINKFIVYIRAKCSKVFISLKCLLIL